jgi:16S rRNA processing protein RimM
MAENTEEPWDLVVGQVTAPFGVEGAVRVRPETEDPERFSRLRQVRLELPSGEERIVTIRSARVTPRGVVLQLEESPNREAAESLRGAWVKIKQSMAIPLAEGSYWVHDIVGLKVVTEEGEDLGEVTEVIRTGANDVYVTPRAMVPAIRDVVRSIDLKAGRIVVSMLPEDESRPSEEGR